LAAHFIGALSPASAGGATIDFAKTMIKSPKTGNSHLRVLFILPPVIESPLLPAGGAR
jgi:hypothetical protein